MILLSFQPFVILCGLLGSWCLFCLFYNYSFFLWGFISYGLFLFLGFVYIYPEIYIYIFFLHPISLFICLLIFSFSIVLYVYLLVCLSTYLSYSSLSRKYNRHCYDCKQQLTNIECYAHVTLNHVIEHYVMLLCDVIICNEGVIKSNDTVMDYNLCIVIMWRNYSKSLWLCSGFMRYTYGSSTYHLLINLTLHASACQDHLKMFFISSVICFCMNKIQDEIYKYISI